MPAKAPIYLKPINSKKGKKCRLRDILSPDMISPPLGDFRHTIHIGRGGERDAFGDMSFLQGKYELLPGKGEVVHPQFGIQSEFLRANSTSDASFAETPSPVLKNAISLPTIGGCQALTLPLISSTVFPLPPEPLDDIVGPTAPMKPDRAEEVEILQMDALLRSMDVFSGEPLPPSDIQSKPDVLLDVLEKPEKPMSKTVAKANKINKGESRSEKPSPYYINGHSNSIYKANGSLNSNTSSDSFDSLDGKGSFKSNGICNGSGSLNGNGNCNGYGYFNNDIALSYKKELSKCNGDWVDRDSGVEEGRICDFEFEFSKEKSSSRDSLTQITGSLLSLELDLGPSILDDVLNIMDKPMVKSRP
ncbi:cdc42 effector protein 3-like [Centroberyx affinis]|uniref:cdc42 effector protein 3-like n=1 Tax=Centroberyx affinis TaxID=166261 RepID=UPI003A5BA19B